MTSMKDDIISRQAAIDKAIMIPVARIVTEDKVLWRKAVFVEDIEVLPPAQPELNRKNLLRTMMAGILATSSKDAYSCGFRNGIRWCRALLEDKEPEYEEALSVQPERKEWIVKDKMMDGEGPGTIILVCPDCGYEVWCAADDGPNFCPNCGADLRGDDDDKS